MNSTKIIQDDLQHIWHPCMQMKDFETFPPIVIQAAKGSYLYTDQGPVIDAISSWWCKSLGHGHPAVLKAIQQQLNQFEHVIGANTTHGLIAELGKKLCQLTGKHHVFFGSDGSSAVEIALKMALHAQQIKGAPQRNQFIALANSYHGETLGTLGVSDLGIYKKPYAGYGPQCHFIQNLPYVSDKHDPLWANADEAWQATLPSLEQIKTSCCALIIEPLIQGAGGMLCYSADFLKKLVTWAQQNDILVIADEIMTGIGRSGKWLASEYAGIDPDMICLSKGLTSGSIPLSCVLIDHTVYELFYDDYTSGKSFLHSHTYSGNALGVAAALATIATIESENILQKANELGKFMYQQFQSIAETTGKLKNVRSLGVMVAGDLEPIPNMRLSTSLYQEAIRQGALIRPIGNVLYWLPPLTTDQQIIVNLAEITLNSIYAIYN